MTEKAREAQREYKRSWREKNKDHIREYHREWEANNKERRKEYTKKYRSEHKETVRKIGREYAKKNRDRISLRRKAYRVRDFLRSVFESDYGRTPTPEEVSLMAKEWLEDGFDHFPMSQGQHEALEYLATHRVRTASECPSTADERQPDGVT